MTHEEQERHQAAGRGVPRVVRQSKATKAKTAKTKRNPFIAEVRHAWRFYSIICNSINASIIVTWLSIPDDIRAVFPPTALAGIALFLLASGSFGVILKQKFKP